MKIWDPQSVIKAETTKNIIFIFCLPHIGISESQPGSVPDRSKSSKTDNNHEGDQLQQDTKNGVGSVTVVMASWFNMELCVLRLKV